MKTLSIAGAALALVLLAGCASEAPPAPSPPSPLPSVGVPGIQTPEPIATSDPVAQDASAQADALNMAAAQLWYADLNQGQHFVAVEQLIEFAAFQGEPADRFAVNEDNLILISLSVQRTASTVVVVSPSGAVFEVYAGGENRYASFDEYLAAPFAVADMPKVTLP